MTEKELLEYVLDRLDWVVRACEMDRDAMNELKELINLLKEKEIL